jgi:hypothetical protein
VRDADKERCSARARVLCATTAAGIRPVSSDTVAPERVERLNLLRLVGTIRASLYEANWAVDGARGGQAGARFMHSAPCSRPLRATTGAGARTAKSAIRPCQHEIFYSGLNISYTYALSFGRFTDSPYQPRAQAKMRTIPLVHVRYIRSDL